MFRTIGLQIGYRYEGSPICVPDGTPAPPDDPENFVASARPGSRAPHVALADGRSTLDLFGRGFVLLRLRRRRARRCRRLRAPREKPACRSRTVTVDEPEAAALYERKLVLVRPGRPRRVARRRGAGRCARDDRSGARRMMRRALGECLHFTAIAGYCGGGCTMGAAAARISSRMPVCGG